MKYLLTPFVLIFTLYNFTLLLMNIAAKADASTLNMAFRTTAPLLTPQEESATLLRISNIKSSEDYILILQKLKATRLEKSVEENKTK